MTSITRFSPVDLLHFNTTNLDKLTETYGLYFYFDYLSKWPEYCKMAVHPSGYTMGYMLGKVEGPGEDWHGHVTAVTVAPEFRRVGLGEKLMNGLEETTEKLHNGYFVDLFVRASNNVAVGMYKKMGYVIYRTVLGYYSAGPNQPAEDGYDMRKPMLRDKERSKPSCIPKEKPITPDELEWA
eukprot:TRINITY_DN76410_c0_g1_i1.p1 TRINITY_DN76410_c0_g1~~TRINITY_DN76410_c0_g1_i1.p1  ORF type:complete len:194 (-),score=5.50 TRINITY_DN76410_c0_g1_i1:137-682(-)